MTFFKKLSVVTTSIVTTAIIISSPAVSTAQPKILVSQGDRFYTKNINCTIGFIDNKNHKAYTAKHCGSNGQEVSVKRNNRFIPIGILNHVQGFGDYSAIDLQENVRGDNSFSGNSIAQPFIGDKVCRYGAKSQKIDCSNIIMINPIEHNIITNTGMNALHGDSGGPTWIPGKGYLGVTSAYAEMPNGKITAIAQHKNSTPFNLYQTIK